MGIVVTHRVHFVLDKNGQYFQNFESEKDAKDFLKYIESSDMYSDGRIEEL